MSFFEQKILLNFSFAAIVMKTMFREINRFIKQKNMKIRVELFLIKFELFREIQSFCLDQVKQKVATG